MFDPLKRQFLRFFFGQLGCNLFIKVGGRGTKEATYCVYVLYRCSGTAGLTLQCWGDVECYGFIDGWW